MMNSGILLIDKPKGVTSNRVIQDLKRQLGVKKIGHAGTLDPLATGVLVVLVNQATKLSDYFLNDDKGYRVALKLYSSTTTADREGDVVETHVDKTVSFDQVEQVVAKYQNYTYDQYPPIFSAIKVAGKKLYQYARDGETVVIKPRAVTIKSLKLLNYDETQGLISLETLVSKGTYIRSLVNDLAKDLGTIGHVHELERIQSGPFLVQNCHNLDTASLEDLIPSAKALQLMGYELYELSPEQVPAAQNGRVLTLATAQNQVFVTNENRLIALYSRIKESSEFKCTKNNLG